MAKKSTSRVRTVKVPSSTRGTTSVRIERISNGYIVAEGKTDGKGKFTEKQTYTKTKPSIKI